MKSASLCILALLLSIVGSASVAVQGFKVDNIVLYQPESVWTERVPSTEALAGYIKSLQAVCEAFFAGASTPATLNVVVAIRPGKQSRVWFLASAPTLGQDLEPLRRKLEAVTPLDIRQGPVAFAIVANIAGGNGKIPKMGPDYEPPMPKEWQEAIAKAGTSRERSEPLALPDDVLKLVWPSNE